MAASATFALKAGVWFRRGRLLIASPDSLGTACPLSGRNSTYRPVQILEAGSDQGNAAAQNNLGLIYRDGLGVPQDYVEAIKWFRLAAGQGNAGAQFNLGNMYRDGR